MSDVAGDKPVAGSQMTLRRRRRLMVLLSVGAMLFAATGFYLHFYLYHPIGSGPAGPVVDRQAFESVWSDRNVKLVGFGDSTTWKTRKIAVMTRFAGCC